MREKVGSFLPHRNSYEEDLEIPTLIRDNRFAVVSGVANAGSSGRYGATLVKTGSD